LRHLEIDSALATEWGEVPAKPSLDSMLGPGALPRLVEQVREHEHETIDLARRLFAAWLGGVVRLGQAPLASAPQNAL
jgi:hypothetical protein